MSVMVMLLMGLVAAAPGTVSAQSFQSASFLTGSNLLVTAGSTNSYGATNVYAKYGSIWGPAYTTNAASVNTTNAQAFQDVELWADRDGSFPSDAAFHAHITGLNASATNVITFNFVGVPRAKGGTASTSAQNAWSFSMTANGTNDVYISTNCPTAPFQGCAALRASSAVSPTGSYGTNCLVKYLGLGGFHP